MAEELSISVASPLNICFMEYEKDWQQPIMKYLTMGKLPKGKKEAKVMKRMVSFYIIMTGELYH